MDVRLNANPREVEAVCTFRVTGKQPEFWWPQSGLVQRAGAMQHVDDLTRLPLHLEAAESVFVAILIESPTTVQSW